MSQPTEILRPLLTAERRLGAFLESAVGGWRDSNGHPMPGGDELIRAARTEIGRFEAVLHNAKERLYDAVQSAGPTEG